MTEGRWAKVSKTRSQISTIFPRLVWTVPGRTRVHAVKTKGSAWGLRVISREGAPSLR